MKKKDLDSNFKQIITINFPKLHTNSILAREILLFTE